MWAALLVYYSSNVDVTLDHSFIALIRYELTVNVIKQELEYNQRNSYVVAMFHPIFKKNSYQGKLMDYGLESGKLKKKIVNWS